MAITTRMLRPPTLSIYLLSSSSSSRGFHCHKVDATSKHSSSLTTPSQPQLIPLLPVSPFTSLSPTLSPTFRSLLTTLFSSLKTHTSNLNPQMLIQKVHVSVHAAYNLYTSIDFYSKRYIFRSWSFVAPHMQAIIDCRFFTLFAVFGSLLASLLCFFEVIILFVFWVFSNYCPVILILTNL